MPHVRSSFCPYHLEHRVFFCDTEVGAKHINFVFRFHQQNTLGRENTQALGMLKQKQVVLTVDTQNCKPLVT